MTEPTWRPWLSRRLLSTWTAFLMTIDIRDFLPSETTEETTRPLTAIDYAECHRRSSLVLAELRHDKLEL